MRLVVEEQKDQMEGYGSIWTRVKGYKRWLNFKRYFASPVYTRAPFYSALPHDVVNLLRTTLGVKDGYEAARFTAIACVVAAHRIITLLDQLRNDFGKRGTLARIRLYFRTAMSKFYSGSHSESGLALVTSLYKTLEAFHAYLKASLPYFSSVAQNQIRAYLQATPADIFRAAARAYIRIFGTSAFKRYSQRANYYRFCQLAAKAIKYLDAVAHSRYLTNHQKKILRRRYIYPLFKLLLARKGCLHRL